MLVLLSPGQGSQTPGLLSPWIDSPGAAADLALWSAATDLDLLHLGTLAGAEELRDTAVAQPLLVAAALLSGRALLAGETPGLVCGHSVGELAALALGGVLTDAEAVVIAAGRGRAMAAAAVTAPTGMAALLGATSVPNRPGLELATVNVAGHVVVGGPVAALDALAVDPPPGVRVRRLDVAGAFHTSAMRSAVEPFRALLADLPRRTALCGVVANADGAVLTDGGELLERLVVQLTSPVRFDLCLEQIGARQPGRLVELAPGGTLGPLVRRGLPGTSVTMLKTTDDLALVTA